MIFGKSKESQLPGPRHYQWPNPDRKYQSLRISIRKVRYSVSGSYGHWSLEFEGRTKALPSEDILFVATFEVLDPFETPSRIRGVWTEFPETVEGVCQLQELDPAELHPPQLNATLYCSPHGVEALFRALAIAGHSGSEAVIDIELDYPGTKGPDFWVQQWTTCELRVRSWRIICESN